MSIMISRTKIEQIIVKAGLKFNECTPSKC